MSAKVIVCQSHASHFITNFISIIYQIRQLALLGLKDYVAFFYQGSNISTFQSLVNKVRQLIRSKFKEQEEQNKDIPTTSEKTVLLLTKS